MVSLKKHIHSIYVFVLLSLFTIGIQSQSQTPTIAKAWEQQVTQTDEFTPAKSSDFLAYDYSSIFSNEWRFKGDIWSTYVGVFGSKNSRIEFHLEVTKATDELYTVSGVSKLGNNIRNLEGQFNIKNFFRSSTMEANIMLFDYELKEPGDRNGDGYFKGIGSIVFLLRDDATVDRFWAASGDLRKYTNVFVGTWTKYNTTASRECIFSFSPTGFAKLPFREYLYKAFDEDDECQCNYEINDTFTKYGWTNYEATAKGEWWVGWDE